MTTPTNPASQDGKKFAVFAHDVITNCVLDEAAAAKFRSEATRQMIRDPETGTVGVFWLKPNGHILMDGLYPETPATPQDSVGAPLSDLIHRGPTPQTSSPAHPQGQAQQAPEWAQKLHDLWMEQQADYPITDPFSAPAAAAVRCCAKELLEAAMRATQQGAGEGK